MTRKNWSAWCLGLVAITTAMLLTGCIGTYPQSLAMVKPEITGDLSGPLRVEVIDNRPYVQSGDKTSQFLGTRHRAMIWGIPENIINASAKPVAQELGDIVASSLRQRGAVLCPSESADMKCKAAKLVKLTLHDWRFSWSRNSELMVDAELAVSDDANTILAKTRVTTRAPLQRPDVQKDFQTQLERLLNQPEIRSALQ